jgi:glycosyltransferase involved in cell wall biosynthesis
LIWVLYATPGVALGLTTRLEVTRELRELGWRVDLVLEGPRDCRDVQGVEVISIPKPRIYLLGYLVFQLRALCLLFQWWTEVDLILFHQNSAPLLLPLRLVRTLIGGQRPLLVMDTRDLNPIQGGLRIRLRVWFYRMVHWLANHWADGQTAITERMAELVQIPSKQLWGIWPSGVTPSHFASAQGARHWPSGDEPVRLIYIGNLLPERNIMLASQAVEKAHALGMKFILTIVGDGAERPALESFASGTLGRVRVLPPVPHDQVPAVLAGAHIGVTSLPPPGEVKYQISSPIKLFEYMAAGLPVLATRNVCHTDVVGDGGYVFWAKEADVQSIVGALGQIWRERAALEHLGHEAATAAQSWTWRASAGKLAAALEYGLACGGPS